MNEAEFNSSGVHPVVLNLECVSHSEGLLKVGWASPSEFLTQHI